MLHLKNIQIIKKSLLEAASFSLIEGECTCLSGPSASGKSLLLRAISDLDEHEGNIFLEGKECREYTAPSWRKQVGLLTAENYWWQHKIGHHFYDESNTQLITWLSLLGLDKSILTRDVNHCSTGEKQRLALLRLLQNHPKVLLLDEPTSSMDPDTVNRVESFLTEFRQQNRTAILWVSHDPQQIKRVADKHIQIQNGQLIEAAVV